MIDIALNLTSSQFSEDREQVMSRALAAGVHHCLLLASDFTEAAEVSVLAERWPKQAYGTAGVHPHHAKDYLLHELEPLRQLLSHPQVIAVGECGLDFNRDFSPRPQQEQIFEAQLAMAAELNMPLVLHERDASTRFIEILSPWRDQLPGAVLHCFTGDKTALYACLDMGLHIGVTGWVCDERRGQELQALVPLIPLDRLLLETDAPYLLPRDLLPKPQGRRNEPMYLPHIYRRVAELRGDDLSAMTAQIKRNFKQLFGL
jgi:TatD DNase family protein